ncbi:MAG: copper resistance protein CopC/CopD [Ardenticatenaceae bacterium]|nr:copper resistance protein CopC/CopD [Ardenticatenaceae bacterium]
MHRRFAIKHIYQIGLALAVTLVAGLVLVHQASAHAFLLRSDPPANAILPESPPAMRLWFNEVISPGFSQARLLDAEGHSLPVTVEADPDDATLLIVNFPELEDGVYSVRWNVLSAADGHPTQGLVVFGVGEGADLGTATAVVQDTAVPWPDPILRWLNFVLLAGLVGCFAVAFLVLDPAVYPPDIAAVQHAAQRRILRLAWWCGVAALLLGVVWAGWQAILLSNTLASGASVSSIAWQWLSQTRLGYLWWLRQGLLALILVCLWPLRRNLAGTAVPQSRVLLSLTTLLLLALLLAQSLTSHAAALARQTAVAIVSDTLHLLAVSLWVGGLLALAAGLLPLVRRREDFAALVKAGWGPFGRLAFLSVGVIFATGLYSTGREVASLDAMLTSLYGRTILLKIGLMLVVGLVGATNSMLIHPRLAAPLARLRHKPAGWTPLTPRKFARLILLEVGLGVLVLGLAGLLTAAPTARGGAYTPASDAPETLSQLVDDMIITLAISPNRAGTNVFTVRAVSNRRPPPAEVLRVILRLTYQDQDLGLTSLDLEEVEPGFYLIGDNALNVAGTWHIDAVVRRRGLEDSVAQFSWVVPQSGPERPVVVSNQPWEPVLTLAAALLLLVVIVVTAVLFITA